ncbi:15398_t:CDS:2, partial [Racocetra persica]
ADELPDNPNLLTRKCNCFSRKNSAYAKPAIALANDGFNGENTNGIFNKEEGSQNNPEIRILELEKQMSVVKRERDQLILEKENTKKWIRKKAEEVEKKMKEYEEEAKKKGIEAEELMQKFGRAVINEWNKDRDERNHL